MSDRCRALHFCNNFHLNIYAMMNLAYTIYCTGGGVISKEFAIHPVDFFPKTHILKINAAHHYMCFINSCRLQNMRNSCEAHVDLCFDSTFRGFSRK